MELSEDGHPELTKEAIGDRFRCRRVALAAREARRGDCLLTASAMCSTLVAMCQGARRRRPCGMEAG